MTEHKRFEELTKALVSVPKDEVDRERKKDEARKKRLAARKASVSKTPARNPAKN